MLQKGAISAASSTCRRSLSTECSSYNMTGWMSISPEGFSMDGQSNQSRQKETPSGRWNLTLCDYGGRRSSHYVSFISVLLYGLAQRSSSRSLDSARLRRIWPVHRLLAEILIGAQKFPRKKLNRPPMHGWRSTSKVIRSLARIQPTGWRFLTISSNLDDRHIFQMKTNSHLQLKKLLKA